MVDFLSPNDSQDTGLHPGIKLCIAIFSRSLEELIPVARPGSKISDSVKMCHYKFFGGTKLCFVTLQVNFFYCADKRKMRIRG